MGPWETPKGKKRGKWCNPKYSGVRKESLEKMPLERTQKSWVEDTSKKG